MKTMMMDQLWGQEDYNKEGQATMTIAMMMMMMMMPPTNNLGNALHRGMPGIRRFTNSCCTNFHWHDDDDDDADDNKLFHTIFQ